MATTPARRHELDWLRVIAFGILIFYHIGMFYVSWSWHVKSVHSLTVLEWPMSLVNPWRLLLLFFISGVALSFFYAKRGATMGLGDRAIRLGLPIAFGMLIGVMPQSYYQVLEAGLFQGDVVEFFPTYLSSAYVDDGLVTPTWNHLWYIVYLLLYSVIVAALWRPLQRSIGRVRRWLDHPWRLVLLPVFPLIVVRLTLTPFFPTTHNLFWDWANHANCFLSLLLGVWVARESWFWERLNALSTTLAVLALGSGSILGICYLGPVSDAIVTSYSDLLWPLRILRLAYTWWAIAALMAWSRRRLNRDGPWLRYLTGGVFAYYVVHQTIIVTVGFHLTRTGLSAPLEITTLVIATAVGCAAIYEGMRRLPWIGVLIGIKTTPDREPRTPDGAKT